MNTRWIAAGALSLGLLCWRPMPAAAAQQGPARESASAANGPSEEVKQISTSELKDWMMKHRKFTLIDVREDNEWQAGHAANAIHISRWTLPSKIGTAVPDKNAHIVLYCLGGVRSAAAAATLQKMGYTNVFSLSGGFRSYQLAGLPVEK